MDERAIHEREPRAGAQFTQPVRQITSMVLVLAVVGLGLYFGRGTIMGIVLSNPWLNGVIITVFILGVLSCFRQVIQLANSVQWIEDFAAEEGEPTGIKVPSLLAPLATLLRTRGARMQLSATSSRSILDSVGQRIDEDREITRYLGNVLIFLGLLGTFYGLATTVPALVETIRGLNPAEGESGTEVFGRLQAGLEAQLGGMGTAFSSSLLGLAGSLVVGLLELFATHGQNRFYRELEEWLSRMTRVSFSVGEEGGVGPETAMMAGVVDHMAEQMEALQLMFTQSDVARAEVDNRLGDLAVSMTRLTDKMEENDGNAALAVVAEGQSEVTQALGQTNAQIAALVGKLEDGEAGMDAEARMRLRSIDVQMLRVLEEIAAGRQEMMGELRTDLAALIRAIRQTRPAGEE